jgi:YfiR/HmsC-like
MRLRPFKTPLFAALLLLSSALGVDALSAESTGREDQLKAAYLLNFVKFVQWPEAKTDGTVVVCFLGENTVHETFAASITGKKIRERPLAARQLAALEPVDGCDVIYIATAVSTAAGAAQFLGVERPVLTVSDVVGFTRNGGIIELFVEKNRLRFKVNIDAARRAGLQVRSDLLQLAASVETAGAK